MDSPQLSEQDFRVYRTVGSSFRKTVGSSFRATLGLFTLLLVVSGCASLPDPHFEKFQFPQNAFVGDVKDRPYTVLGLVKNRVDYNTLDAAHEEADLCRNYFNKGVRELLRIAKNQGADAVIDVRSVVFFEDGSSKTYSDPECSDDGQDGQILVQAIAVRWKAAAPSKTVEKFKTEFIPVNQVPRPLPSGSVGSIEGRATVDPSLKKFRSLRLSQAQDGLDGGIRILANPTRLVLFTLDKKVLDQENIEAKHLWLSSEFFASAHQRTVLVNSENDGEVLSHLYRLGSGTLLPEKAVEVELTEPQVITLYRGKYSAWKVVPGPHGTKEILQVVSSEKEKQVAYVRYRFTSSGGWTRRLNAQKGTWNAKDPFPAEERFSSSGT